MHWVQSVMVRYSSAPIMRPWRSPHLLLDRSSFSASARGRISTPLDAKTRENTAAMKLISLAATAVCASAFIAPISTTHSAAVSSTALRSTRRDPITGKIYVGEPEPLEELADLVGGLLGGLGRVADGLLGPAPVPIPIPVEDEREQAPEQPPVGTDPYKYPGTY